MSVFSGLLMCMTILFGISAQMLLLDVHLKNLRKAHRIFFVVGNLLVLVTNLSLSLVLPVDLHMKLYVLVIHMPIFLIFWITTERTPIKVIFSLFTSVFMIYPANVVLTIVSSTMKWLYPVGFYFVYIAVCLIMLLIINCYFKPYFHYLINNYSGLSFVKLCLLPLAYYIVNYWLGLYNYSLVKTTGIMSLRILIFLMTLISYVLIFDIAKSSREKEALQGSKTALSLLLESANQQLSALQATQKQAAVYRHDMRHHLALIGGFIADGEIEKAEKYIRFTQADIDAITPKRYCENNTINLILSYFEARAKNKGVVFSVDAQLPQVLSIPETELCALLSNGLDNAIEASAQVADEQFRKVIINCQSHKNNLLIHIENSFTGKVKMENGIPQSLREGHGFGVKSIAMIAEKYNGYCSFDAKDEIFIMRLVLPLKEC